MGQLIILVVDDEAAIRFGIREFLKPHGYQVEEADTCAAAEQIFRTSRPDVVLLDYKLPDGTALDLLPRLQQIDAEIPFVVLTAHGSIDLAVQAIKLGAEQFLTKPVELPALLAILERLIDHQRNRKKQAADSLRQSRQPADPFVGASAAIRALAEQARRVAASDSPLLILGETGSGKGVLAQWLHHHGPRAREAVVDLNCAGLSKEFLDTELFGHEKGAFTGAVAAKPGLLEVAHRGTLFLDEIGDMDLQVQPKLLTVLEDKRFRRLGGVSDRQVDIRLISATHADLYRRVQDKTFRSDLYFRISTFPLRVPSLRQRVEDIPILARSLLKNLATEFGHGDLSLTPGAEAALQAYAWPGNIRELRNVLERAVLLCDRAVLDTKDLRFEMGGAATPVANDTQLTLLGLERRHIERVLAEEGGQVARAAERLGIPKSSLYQKLKQYKLGK